jgi:myo-inositol-1(or 4)-monophosphatase
MSIDLANRTQKAVSIAEDAAALAMSYFKNPDRLNTRSKGIQDPVSDGDVAVEKRIRAALLSHFPGDGVIGEEEDPVAPNGSQYSWVIDPIDGTNNFIRGAPGWCIVLCMVDEKQSLIGVVHDPIAQETFVGVRGQGATLNGAPIRCSEAKALNQGAVGVGMSRRVAPKQIVQTVSDITEHGGAFFRNGSGALGLAYVASGRLIGYVEPHMNAWDCLASMLLVEEAGGLVEPFDMPAMLADGGRVIAGCEGVYEELRTICEGAYQ